MKACKVISHLHRKSIRNIMSKYKAIGIGNAIVITRESILNIM